MEKKVVVIGLDGATFDYITPWTKEGILPNLASLLRTSAWGELESTLPSSSPVAWSSFVTGTNPGKHGIYSWFRREENSYQWIPVTGEDRKGRTIWQALNYAGYTVGIIGLPLTYPPPKVKGFFISGFDTPEKATDFFYPKNLPQILRREGIDYKILPSLQQKEDPNYLERWRLVEETRTKASLFLYRKYQPDFFFVLFPITDHFNHFATDIDQLKDAYKIADKNLGKVLSLVDKNSLVIVMSDHGSMQYHRLFLTAKWLARNGYLTFDDVLSKARIEELATLAFPKASDSFLPRFVGTAWAITPKVLKQAATKVIQRTTIGGFEYSMILWEKTRVYTKSRTGQLWINLNGREPGGIVKPGREFEKLRDEVIKKILSVNDPSTGRKFFAWAKRGGEIYHGPRGNLAPDIVFVPRLEEDMFDPFNFRDDGHFFRLPSAPFGGEHTQRGIIIIKGSGLPTRKIKGTTIADLMPTLLSFFDLKTTRSLDGKVIKLKN